MSVLGRILGPIVLGGLATVFAGAQAEKPKEAETAGASHGAPTTEVATNSLSSDAVMTAIKRQAGPKVPGAGM